jgi:hypothetical protein
MKLAQTNFSKGRRNLVEVDEPGALTQGSIAARMQPWAGLHNLVEVIGRDSENAVRQSCRNGAADNGESTAESYGNAAGDNRQSITCESGIAAGEGPQFLINPSFQRGDENGRMLSQTVLTVFHHTAFRSGFGGHHAPEETVKTVSGFATVVYPSLKGGVNEKRQTVFTTIFHPSLKRGANEKRYTI